MNPSPSPPPSNRPAKPLASFSLNLVRARRPVPLLAFREIGYGYIPGQTFCVSVAGHLFVVIITLLLNNGVSLRRPLTVAKTQSAILRRATVYLPILGGGTGGRGQNHRSRKSGKNAVRMLARNGRGFAYPGPQPIVSNPPQDVLGTQTILREMKNLPLFKHDLTLPNLIRPPSRLDDAHPLVVKSESHSPSDNRRKERAITAPKIQLPARTAHDMIPALAESRPVPPTKAEPEPAPSSAGDRGKEQTGLLVLNAIPVPHTSTQIPLAERRSLFAVSPAEAAELAEPAVGTKSEDQTSQGNGSGSHAQVARGDALAESAANSSTLNRSSRAKEANGGGRSGGDASQGFGSGAADQGSGRDTGSGEGIGTGPMQGTGSGAGKGSAPGTGAFRGITIQGGRYGNNGSVGANPAPRRQTSYSMTIISAGHSGGGLPDLGFFRNDKVYTVFLDMRAKDDDPAPSWILQYALLRPPATETEADAHRIPGTPTPPYATLKEIPVLPSKFFRKGAHPLIIASAVMTPGGNLEQVSVIQSPDDEFIKPVVEALRHWTFEPARLDGQAVGLKVLLGVRLMLSP